MHTVAALALPDVVAFDLSTPAQIFGHRDERDRYAFTVCAARPGPVPSTTGFSIEATAGLGALATAGAGLLDGREATTHWQHADELAGRFPAVRVSPNRLFVDEGAVLTSAG